MLQWDSKRSILKTKLHLSELPFYVDGFLKGRKPKPKEFPAPQKQLLRQMYRGVSTADAALTQAQQSPFQAGSTYIAFEGCKFENGMESS